MRTTLAVLAVAFFGAGVARGENYYDANDPNPAPLKYTDAQLVGTINQELGRKKVKSPAAGDVAKLSRPEKIALLYALSSGKPGSELDAMVEDGGQYVPVEVHWDGDKIAIKAGTPRAQLYGKASSKEEIQKKFGIGPFVDDDAKWDNDTLYMVETALGTLSKEELEAIAGLPFHRMTKDPHKKGGKGVAVAMYVPEKMQIELYDHGIEADKRLFMGTVEKPLPRSVATLIHECGHAIARKGARDMRRQIEVVKKEYDELNASIPAEKKKGDAAALKKLQADIAAKKKQFDELAAAMVAVETKGSPLERGLDAKSSFKKSPTLYGRTSVAESFADCLALFKLDRAALERAAPAAAAWFDSPEYASLLKGP